MSEQTPPSISRFQAPYHIRKTPVGQTYNGPQSLTKIYPIPNRFEGEVPITLPAPGSK